LIFDSKTKKAYEPKQNEFIRWARNHPNYCMDAHPEKVTPQKLLVFLIEEQNDRTSRRATESNRTIGIRTFELYVNAITDLHKQQVRSILDSMSKR
jgi:hypothetical protein